MENKKIINFVKQVSEMAGTASINVNKKSWDLSTTKEYTTEQIEKAIKDDDVKTLREISKFYFNKSGIYKRFLIYLANLLTWDTMVNIKVLDGKVNKKMADSLQEACLFLDKLNLKSELPRILLTVLVEGVYYGIFKELEGGKVMFQDLPADYCRARYKSANGNLILELNLEYFDAMADKLSDDKNRVKFLSTLLDTFPKDIKQAYFRFKRGDVSNLIDGKYYMVKEGEGMAFYFYTQSPLLLATTLAIRNLDNYRKLEEALDKKDLKKLLYQKLPIDKESGDLLVETEEAVGIHNAARNMLSSNKDLDVLTGFCDIEMLDLGDSVKTDRDNLLKIERSVYNESGITKSLFAADTNLALKYSLNNDFSLVIMMVDTMFIAFLETLLNKKFSKGKKYFFEVSILPITHYNREEMATMYLKGAQFGFSKILAGIAMGTKQSDLLTQLALENDIYSLHEIMKPLQSSFTSSGKEEKSGAPMKDDVEQSDKTIQNKESQ